MTRHAAIFILAVLAGAALFAEAYPVAGFLAFTAILVLMVEANDERRDARRRNRK